MIVNKLCSQECRVEWGRIPENREFKQKRTEESLMKKYGVKSTFLLPTFKEKSDNTKLEKYGDENYNNREKL